MMKKIKEKKNKFQKYFTTVKFEKVVFEIIKF